ncbi:hypothetical protein B0H19DRAFT_1136310 [Mycena capillaripes]|nr:hypothetical protein B0H19DRAFT_1136310 [Mycena capillaripes]
MSDCSPLLLCARHGCLPDPWDDYHANCTDTHQKQSGAFIRAGQRGGGHHPGRGRCIIGQRQRILISLCRSLFGLPVGSGRYFSRQRLLRTSCVDLLPIEDRCRPFRSFVRVHSSSRRGPVDDHSGRGGFGRPYRRTKGRPHPLGLSVRSICQVDFPYRGCEERLATHAASFLPMGSRRLPDPHYRASRPGSSQCLRICIRPQGPCGGSYACRRQGCTPPWVVSEHLDVVLSACRRQKRNCVSEGSS